MAGSHTHSHGVEVTQRFAQGGLAVVVTVISVITLATLLYAWFFT